VQGDHDSEREARLFQVGRDFAIKVLSAKLISRHRRLMEIMLENDTIIQSYWRSIKKHARPHSKGTKTHQAFELHIDKIWLQS
jgi:hypothetical protein